MQAALHPMRHGYAPCRHAEEGEVTLPLTEYFEGRKRFYFGKSGAIYMGNGIPHSLLCVSYCSTNNVTIETMPCCTMMELQAAKEAQ